MILGVGLDVVEVDRIERAMENPRFVRRVLTPAERSFCKTPMRVAGRWAAKEAVAKATGLRLSWQDVEVLSASSGAPAATIHHPEWPAVCRLHLTITHERGIAAAVAIVEDGAGS